MPARPELIRPDNAAIAAAMSRALTALAALVQALGDGEHTINLVAERTDDTFVRGEADLSVGTAPLRLAVLDEDDYAALRTLLVFALEGSTVRGAVLVATTAAEPHRRACGWTVGNGWLHPMDTAELQQAVIPCPGVSAVLREVYDAPVLPQIHRRGEPPWLTRPPSPPTASAPIPPRSPAPSAPSTPRTPARSSFTCPAAATCPCGKDVSLTERDDLRRPQAAAGVAPTDAVPVSPFPPQGGWNGQPGQSPAGRRPAAPTPAPPLRRARGGRPQLTEPPRSLSP